MINIPREISKTRKLKTPLIPDELLIIIREQFKLHLEPKDYYIIGKYGKPGTEHLGKNTMRLRFNKIRKQLDMPLDYMLYSWKHTGNVRLEEANIPTFDRMMQNGHTSIRTTEIYTRNKVGFRSEAIRKTFPKLV
jgi:integrase